MILELKRFKKVVEIGNVTKASEVLFITQPALTQSIHRLEKELGIKLFNQIGKRIFLSEWGKIVYEQSEKIISLWEKTKNIKNASDLTSCSIGLFDSAALDLSKYIQDKLKKTKLEIIIDRSENLLRKLNYGLLDICVCAIPGNYSQFTNIKLVKSYKEKLIPVSSKVWKEKISEIPFILYSKDSVSQQYVEEAFIRNRIKPKVVAEAVNPLFIKELTLKSFGVAFLPENMVIEEIKGRKLFIQKFPTQVRRTCGIFRSKEELSKETEEILMEIITEFTI